MQIPNSTTGQNIYAGEALPSRAGYSSLEMQGVPGNQDGSRDSVLQGIRMELSCALQYQGDTGSRSSSNSIPIQYFEGERAETPLLQFVYSVQRERLQQEEQKAYGHYSVFQGQQQNGWGYHLQQLQQPQNYQVKLSPQDQLLMHQSPRNIGQQVPSLQQEQCYQSNQDVPCYQTQHASLQMMAGFPPMLLGQAMQQGATEQSRAQLRDQQSTNVHLRYQN